MQYYPWLNDDEEQSFAWLSEKLPDELKNNSYKLKLGKSATSWFPEGITFDLSMNHGQKLTDFIPNVHGIFVISESLKNVLNNADKNIEFFPVRIKNHKKKIENIKYYLANFIGSIECIDHNNSDFVTNSIRKDQVLYFKKLSINESKIPTGKSIFRLGELKRLLIINEPLAIEIVRKEKLTGMLFQQMEEYGEEYRDMYEEA